VNIRHKRDNCLYFNNATNRTISRICLTVEHLSNRRMESSVFIQFSIFLALMRESGKESSKCNETNMIHALLRTLLGYEAKMLLQTSVKNAVILDPW
jgi:hypothetical protein